jgi:thiol-disulfide isomerase/thioredoxin
MCVADYPANCLGSTGPKGSAGAGKGRTTHQNRRSETVLFSNRWLCRLEGVALVTVGLAVHCPAVVAQQLIDSRAGAKQPAPRTFGGLGSVNPYAEDAEAVAARYRVPETNDVTELMAFIIYLRSYEPHDTQTYLIHRKQMPPAVRTAAEKILRLELAAHKPTPEEPEPTTNAYHQASMLILVCQVQMLTDLTAAQQRELFLQINKRLSVTHPPQGDLQLAMQLATRLEMTANTPLAVEAYTSFSKIFSTNDNPDVVEIGKTFVAAARRMSLLGKPIEVVGHTVDGRQFDWKAYQGKVVLIDYWFAGCEPCRRELPNIKRMYQLYRDRGFEVVGINVDDDRADAEKFLRSEGVPWANLFDTNNSGDHPMSAYYGVLSFPTALLVGKDGTVVSLTARGEKLQELLAKMLGPAGDGPPNDSRNARTGTAPANR